MSQLFVNSLWFSCVLRSPVGNDLVRPPEHSTAGLVMLTGLVRTSGYFVCMSTFVGLLLADDFDNSLNHSGVSPKVGCLE